MTGVSQLWGPIMASLLQRMVSAGRGSAIALVFGLAIALPPLSAANGQVVINGHNFRPEVAGTGANLPAAAAQGQPPPTAISYGAGKIDDLDGKLYTAWYDPVSRVGGGVATWWNDQVTSSGVSANTSGLFCSLPMIYDGPDTTYRERVKGTPIPAFVFGTLVRVINTRSRQWIVCSLIDRGPALYTGAAIDLSTDAKLGLGMAPGDSGTNSYVVYEVLANYDSTFTFVRPVQ
jgi:hypothetical protein